MNAAEPDHSVVEGPGQESGGPLVRACDECMQIPRMCEKGRAKNRKFVLVSCVFVLTFNCPVDTRKEIC